MGRFHSYASKVKKVLGFNEMLKEGIDGTGYSYLELEGINSKHGKAVLATADFLLPNAKKYLIEDMNMIEAIHWAIENKITVIGASIGGVINEELNKALFEYEDAGGVLITSAGNHGENMEDYKNFAYMSCFISCGALQWKEDFKYLHKTPYSAWGKPLDFVLPVITKAPGTSFTQPILAMQTICIIQALDLKWGHSSNSEIVYDTLRVLSVDLGEKGFDELTGFGMPILSTVKMKQQPVRELIEMQIDNGEAFFNGVPIQLRVPPFIKSYGDGEYGATCMEVRPFLEALGFTVDYNDDTKEVKAWR